MEILRSIPLRGFSIPEIVAELEKSGAKVTPEEKDLASKMIEFDEPGLRNIENDFQDRYGNKLMDFQRKYSDKTRDIVKEKKPTTMSQIMESLEEQGIQFTDDEKALIKARKELDNNPLLQKKYAFNKENREQISKFFSDRQLFITGMYNNQSINERNKKMGKLLGIHSGLAIDLMNAQDICNQMAREMIPIPDDKMKTEQKNISSPFIASYIKLKNDELKAKINENTMAAKKGNASTKSVVKQVPKTEAEKVFDAILANYRGKVIFIDFWATWCAPCRSGIEQIKPLKEELADKNVAFVYITNQSSPQATYNNMIPDIKGEHYRLSTDEWNVLSGRFQISGIPHYMVAGKDGRIINEHLPFMGNEQLKNLLMKYEKE